MTDVLTIVATLRAAKGRGDELEALLVEQAGVVRRQEPGCLVYRVHRARKDPDLFMFYEMYVDAAALDAHVKSPHFATYRERWDKDGLVDGPLEFKIYRSITE